MSCPSIIAWSLAAFWAPTALTDIYHFLLSKRTVVRDRVNSNLKQLFKLILMNVF